MYRIIIFLFDKIQSYHVKAVDAVLCGSGGVVTWGPVFQWVDPRRSGCI